MGADVMITIFCDFCHFSAKMLAFFSKNNVMIIFFQKLGAGMQFEQKRQFFAKWFGENFEQIITYRSLVKHQISRKSR
jgi:hypothetical protein